MWLSATSKPSLCINQHSEHLGYISDGVANTEATTTQKYILFNALAKEG